MSRNSYHQESTFRLNFPIFNGNDYSVKKRIPTIDEFYEVLEKAKFHKKEAEEYQKKVDAIELAIHRGKGFLVDKDDKLIITYRFVEMRQKKKEYNKNINYKY